MATNKTTNNRTAKNNTTKKDTNRRTGTNSNKGGSTRTKGASKNKKPTWKRWLWLRFKMAIKILFFLLLLVIVIGGIWFYKEYGSTILEMQDEAKNLVAAADTSTFSRNRASTVYDINGDVIDVFTTSGKSGYICFDDIPKYAVDAIIATEDRDFYNHNGVSASATSKAVFELIKNKGYVKRGGSTITQQLAKNIFLSNEVSWQRKTEEIFLATELEKKYEKYEILEFYLNNIYYANGYYGIEAASQGYFSCSAGDLDLSQIAFLTAIPNSPTMYDPLVHMDKTLERRDRVLEQMRDEGYISTSDYNVAIEETITLKLSEETKKNVSNYVVSYVNSCAVKAIMESEGFDMSLANGTEQERKQYDDFYDVCQRYIYSKGYNIYTSIDMKKQTELQRTINSTLKEFKDKKDDGVYNIQGAAVCIDNSTGHVTAIVGGRSQSASSYGINRAYQSYRQPGSSLKPLLIYAYAFENGYTPDTKVLDEEMEDGPNNSGDYYAGEVDVRYAIEHSSNVVAWKLFEELIPHNCLNHIVEMGFKRITYEDDNMATALGGTQYGASALEMAAAYATLENDGIYRNPTCIEYVTDVYGNKLISYENDKKVIYDENASRMVTDCMKGVLDTGTAKGYGIDGITCAGKTGTTNDKKDGWFVGYSSYYTTAVWVGGDNPVAMDDLQGNTYPLYIWHDYMTRIHKGLDDKEFNPYKIVVE